MITFDEAIRVMDDRFGSDSLIAVATLEEGRPSVRAVDGYYHEGSFYVVTHDRSNKLRQIAADPVVGLCGEWFSGHGVAENLGPLEDADPALVARVRAAFAGWLRPGGHVDPADPHNRLLRIRLTDGVLTIDDVRHAIDFEAGTA